MMRLTGESPSPAETCNRRVPERYCVAARRGGKLREGNCSAQKRIPMRLNSIRPPRLANLRRKGEAERAARPGASSQRVSERTAGAVRVVGVSGAGEFINGTLRALLVLDGSSWAVRVSIVAPEHGKAVRVKGDRKVKA